MEEGFDAAQYFAKEHLYALVKRRTNRDKDNAITRLVVYCDRGRVPYDTGSGRRDVGSKRRECPFRLQVARAGEAWKILVSNRTHNHPPLRDVASSVIHRKRSAEQRDELAKRVRRESARNIVADERDNGTTLVPKDVYNDTQRLRKGMLNALPPTQAILLRLSAWRGAPAVRRSDEGHLTALHLPTTRLDFFRGFVGPLIMDATYKTNRLVLQAKCSELRFEVRVGGSTGWEADLR
jgi:hypothetical protein